MSNSRLDALRGGAATAVLVLAVLSRGDVLVLGALLVLVAWRLPALVLLPALLAAGWRFGSTSLEALAGAQGVLGPAGLVDPARGAAASWCAAAAVVLVAPAEGPWTEDAGADAPKPRWGRLLVAAATGVAAAVVVAGPAPGGDLWVRVVASVVGAAAALGVLALRARGAAPGRALDIAGGAAGLAAVPLLVGEAPGWDGTVDGDALRLGIVLALAVMAVAIATPRSIAAARSHRRHRTPPAPEPTPT